MVNYDVIVIGGGIIGLCSAYYLANEGYKVAIIDKENFNSNCSQENAGLIVPSHVVPIASPGMISKGVKWMFNPESPFSIKPSTNSNFIKWVWEFYKASNEKRVNVAMPLLQFLNVRSKQLFEEFSTEINLSFDLKKNGLVMYCNSQEGLDSEIDLALKAKSLGMKVQIIGSSELKEFDPGVKVNSIGAVYYPDDASLDPSAFCLELRKLLGRMNVDLFANEELKEFEFKKGKIEGIKTTTSKLRAEKYIVAAGSWSQQVLKKLKIRLPLQGGKGFSFQVQSSPLKLQVPAILSEAKVAVSPLGSSLRFAGTMELNGLDETINTRKVQGIKKAVKNFFPLMTENQLNAVNNYWVGLRPCSPDGLPYIGKINEYSNLYVNTGHAMMGVSLAPISGKIISSVITKNKFEKDISLLNPNRFR